MSCFDRFLIVRTDRIGDVVLSLPVSRAIKNHCPGSKVFYLVNPYASPLIKEHPWIDGFIEVQVKNRYRGDLIGIREFIAGLKKLRKLNPDVSIMLYSKPGIVFMLKFAGIKLAGYKNRLYSVLYNFKMPAPQNPIHEVQKNLMLL